MWNHCGAPEWSPPGLPSSEERLPLKTLHWRSTAGQLSPPSQNAWKQAHLTISTWSRTARQYDGSPRALARYAMSYPGLFRLAWSATEGSMPIRRVVKSVVCDGSWNAGAVG